MAQGKLEKSKMIDYARIIVKAGNGGNGAGSFFRGKGGRFGKASGGDGGKGGDVYIEATNDLNTLEAFRFEKDFRAENGVGGSSNFRKGAAGQDLVLKVPVGTEIKISNFKFQISNRQPRDTSDGGRLTESDSGSHDSSEVKEMMELDLVNHGQRVLVVQGGQGGRGNAKLRDEYGRRPRSGEKGKAGEFCELTLELKLIADAGLIGLPNAGKSTLLAALTNAEPAIAPYPFTTLEPNLGVVNSSQFTPLRQGFAGRAVDGSQKEQKQDHAATVNREPITVNKPAKLVMADIPGLVEGASGGKGLGDLFLRHIERTKVLVHLVDSSQFNVHSSQVGQSAATINREPITVNSLWQDYQTIRNELKAYSNAITKPGLGSLIKKPEIIVITKIDLVAREFFEKVKREFGKHRKKVIGISAATGEGLDDLVKKLGSVLARVKEKGSG